MNRRLFVSGALAALVTPTRLFAQSSGAEDFVVFAPDVVAAYLAAYKNGTDGSDGDEPLLLFFVSYEFANADAATEAFPDICNGIEQAMVESLEALDRPKSENRVVEVSLGKLADDRFAVANKAEDYASQTWSAIRVGQEVLTTQSVAFSPDHLPFIVSWYTDFLGSLNGQNVTLLPELADMPVGWEVQARKTDVTGDVRKSTPATPMVVS